MRTTVVVTATKVSGAGETSNSLNFFQAKSLSLDENQILLTAPEIHSGLFVAPIAPVVARVEVIKFVARVEGGLSFNIVPQTLAVVISLHAGPVPRKAGVVPLGIDGILVVGSVWVGSPVVGGETEGLFGMIVHPLAVGEPTTAAITAGFEKVEFLVVSGLGKLVPRAGRPSLVAREALPVDVVAVAVEGFLFVEEDAG